MLLIAMLIAALVVAYTACARPNWFWTAFLSAPTILSMLSPADNFDPNGIAMGPLRLRLSDPSMLGLLIGLLYHFRPKHLRSLRRQPGGITLALILFFLTIKLLLTVLTGGALIASNPIANGYLGGLVAAAGEVRDNFVPLIAAFYAAISARRLKLSTLTAPFVIAIGVILLRAATQITASGKIWSNGGEFRFINSSEAITLLLLSFLLPFLRSSGPSRAGLRSLACVAFAVAMTANHRSVWLCALLAVMVLLGLAVSGKLQLSKDKSVRAVYAVSIALTLITGSAVLLSGSSELQGFSDSKGLGQRLLAFTDPGSDPDASWRLSLWIDRVDQIGDTWIWGRQLGDRRQSLVAGNWVAVPNHSGYVTTVELGGLLLLSLVVAYWWALAAGAIKSLRMKSLASESWPPAVALIVIAMALGYAISYDFSFLGPALATILTSRQCGQPLLVKRGVRCVTRNAAPVWTPQPHLG